MQNKANWKIDQMTITKVLTTDYNRVDTWYRGNNKANTKPIKANLFLSSTKLFGAAGKVVVDTKEPKD